MVQHLEPVSDLPPVADFACDPPAHLCPPAPVGPRGQLLPLLHAQLRARLLHLLLAHWRLPLPVLPLRLTVLALAVLVLQLQLVMAMLLLPLLLPQLAALTGDGARAAQPQAVQTLAPAAASMWLPRHAWPYSVDNCRRHP